ncbi:DNA mismatch repair protein MutS [Candidatus Methylomirabilis limnetica]|uniref:DNA mismatch repair protein MutS n=1 Tax=Candidatus Methylomirabilis limnetica TaxID=2033718 RepID=A0A2T4TVY3_9BACT|nr:DNA mismatch repair protein MutS [Candidatus Methylomirabilis limnetica]PTL35248.1 DNA mismatch repair protein MutS [Candidatus Methylomirabilis limnetica]
MHEPLLTAIGKDLSVRSARAAKTGEGVLDESTFNTIEVDRLFDAVNCASTVVGQATLYRSLAHPLNSVEAITAKQDALKELDSKADLRIQVEGLVQHAAKYEEEFYRLLFGTFVGTFGNPLGKMETGSFGHATYRQGTKLMLDLVKGAQGLPTPESPYLRARLEALKAFGSTRSHALMKGPVYLTERAIRTKAEKWLLAPAIKFRPTLFKPRLIITLLIAMGLLLHYAPALGVSRHAMPVLMVVLLPSLLLYGPLIGGFDRDSIIYPLRDGYRDSRDVQQALEALGQIDELLSFHRYAKAFGSSTVLPTLIESDQHAMVLKTVRNPILGKGNVDYVPNDINLNGARLTFITGPNGGGKTACCKTIAQVQLLAQIGCYVPAEQAQVSVADRIFYQVPESNSLADREGRFGTELQRTKAIFFASSPRSLVVLDELAEGTTYQEKLEISRTILGGFYQVGNNTILVTHNHELAEQFQQRDVGSYRQAEFIHGSPTHRLIEGISRVSHADKVARRIGFAKEDIERHLAERGYVGGCETSSEGK